MSRKIKDSGIEWIGEIPEDWEIIRLKFLGSTKSGLGNKKPADFGHGYPFISYKNIYSNMTIDSNYPDLVDSTDIDRKNFNVLRGDTFFTGSSETIEELGFSSVCIEDIPNATFNGFCIRFRPNNFTNYNPEYYKYYFRSHATRGYLIQNDNSITRVNLSQKTLKSMPIVIPSMIQQQKIATFLDKKVAEIDHILEKTRESIEEYKKYKQSILTEAVTKGLNPDVKMKDSGIEWIGEIPEHWEITRPFRVCEVIRGNCGFQKNDLKNDGEFIALQYGKTYKVDEVDNEFNFYVDELFYKEDQVVNNGDTILISTSETLEDLGHSCFYSRQDIGLLGGEQMCLKPNNELIENKFLYYATTYFNVELNQYATGLKVYRFKVNDLKRINIVIPPLDEQLKINSYLDKMLPFIESILSDKEKLISDLETYKKSLIYECVTGKREVI